VLKLQTLTFPSAPGSPASEDGQIVGLFAGQAEAAVRLAYHLTRDREAALDLSQEAFVKAIEALHTLEDPARAAFWFKRIVVNLCRDWIRHREVERKALRMASEARAEEEIPAQHLESDEDKERVRRLLMELPLELREVLLLVAVEGLSPKDAAGVLSVPEGTLRWRLHEARKLLKERFERIRGGP
jgi:RNA polymerase sigma-70 factor (ECF subfamily)